MVWALQMQGPGNARFGVIDLPRAEIARQHLNLMASGLQMLNHVSGQLFPSADFQGWIIV